MSSREQYKATTKSDLSKEKTIFQWWPSEPTGKQPKFYKFWKTGDIRSE